MPKRSHAVLAAVTAAGLLLAACSDPPPPDPKTEWTSAMQAAGFVPNPPHTYDEMFTDAQQFCAAGSALAITGLARTALDPAKAADTAMPAPGKNPDDAAKAYGDATWKWACGHTQ